MRQPRDRKIRQQKLLLYNTHLIPSLLLCDWPLLLAGALVSDFAKSLQHEKKAAETEGGKGQNLAESSFSIITGRLSLLRISSAPSQSGLLGHTYLQHMRQKLKCSVRLGVGKDQERQLQTGSIPVATPWRELSLFMFVF